MNDMLTRPAGAGSVVWSPRYLDYAWSPYHPMNPARLDLAMALARSLGVLDDVEPVAPDAAADGDLLRVHAPAYVEAVRTAVPSPDSDEPDEFGLGGDDNPVFERMHDAAAVIVGGTLRAAQEIAGGRASRAVSIGGGMHHAMPGSAAGFCVYNDVAVAIAWLLDNGYSRIAYIDVDVHHGDGVQQAFHDDPRVLTVSLHQDPATLWPSTGHAHDVGVGRGIGTAVNLPLPPGTDDARWLRAFHAVVPAAIAAFGPEIIVSQCGVDTHREDPLAQFSMTVDGQRAAFWAMRELADRHTGGRWLAVGGGGYELLRVVPRAWAHLLGIVLDRPVEVTAPIPREWREHVRTLVADAELPDTMGDGGDLAFAPWPGPRSEADADGPGDLTTRVDAAITDTRRAVFPLLGLDPDAPS
ncbi:MAG: acetoin utilization protein AcuC [Gordonia sp. (in: high G+C Gram-positive bacteria)]|uniref:acetoin utilization protein AcuC n=1 Tax=Gordonia sp. (in: high G+C Gram-positive bacteria) TaxID=84139 RepID=UPI0039E5E167